MRTVLQRVLRAEVRVGDEIVGRIDRGMVALVGVDRADTEADAVITARKIASLRMFPGQAPMDRTLLEIGGSALVVSQFTLLGTVRKGRRPSFDAAQDPGPAEALYRRVCELLRNEGVVVETGRFGAAMTVELVCDGPVTLLVFTEGGSLL